MTCKHFTRLSFRLVSPPTIATPNNNLLNNNFVSNEQRVWLARLLANKIKDRYILHLITEILLYNYKAHHMKYRYYPWRKITHH